jgi:hypothetical protein
MIYYIYILFFIIVVNILYKCVVPQCIPGIFCKIIKNCPAHPVTMLILIDDVSFAYLYCCKSNYNCKMENR